MTCFIAWTLLVLGGLLTGCVDFSGPCPPGLAAADAPPEQFQTTEVTVLPPDQKMSENPSYPDYSLSAAMAYAYDITGAGKKVNAFGDVLRRVTGAGSFGAGTVEDIHQAARSGVLNLLFSIQPSAWPAKCGTVSMQLGMPKATVAEPMGMLNAAPVSIAGSIDDGFDVRLPSFVPAAQMHPLQLYGVVVDTPVRLPLYVVHAQAERQGDELVGQIHGVLKKEDIERVFGPDLATAFTFIVRRNDPGRNRDLYPLSGRAADFIDTLKICSRDAFRTCVVPSNTVSTDSGFLAIHPDVKVFNNGAFFPSPDAPKEALDAVSFGLAFRASRTTITSPQCSARGLCQDPGFTIQDSSCTRIPFPDRIDRIHGTTPGDVWVALHQSYSTDFTSVLRHFDGLRWTGVLPPGGKEAYPTGFVRTVWANSQYEVYSAADSLAPPRSDLFRYDGVEWSREQSFPMSNIEDIFAMDGALFVLVKSQETLGLFKRQGGQWTQDPGLSVALPMMIDTGTKPEIRNHLRGAGGSLWMSSASGLYHRDLTDPNGKWQQQVFVGDNGENMLSALVDVVVLSRDEVWTVSRQGGVYRLKNGAWSAQPKGGLSSPLEALWGESPQHLVAVGVNRWTWGGDNWGEPETIEPNRASAVWGSGDALVVGTNCGIVRPRQ